MSKLPATLKPTLYDVTKLAREAQARRLWTLAYRQSRSMVRDRRATTAATAYAWALDHLRRRFGPSGWPLAQLAGRLVLELRTPGHAASGSLADLHRQGLANAAGQPTRCLSVERMSGWRMAWSVDPLASVNANRSFRALKARQLREERITRREVARAMAEDRLVLAETRPVVTDAGRRALAEAGA